MAAEPLLRVFYSWGGRKYHGTPDCPAWESAQALWDGDDPDYPVDGPYNGGYAMQRAHERYAYLSEGKRPCLVCLPGPAPSFPVNDDFGHRPAERIVQGRVAGLVCLRCRIPHRQDEWQIDGDIIRVTGFSLVKWPCTSALVLGLVDRDAFAYDEDLRMAA